MQQAEKVMSEQDSWIEVGNLNDIPKLGARVVRTADGDIAVFRTADDEIFALRDKCPHKGGPLSQGIVHGKRVACPLHDWKIQLDSGEAVAPDEGCAASYPVKVEGELILLSLTPNEGCPNS
ncbi:MAG: nitrite reductase small subunit NirD [Gammaproteobacteria bacterium]